LICKHKLLLDELERLKNTLNVGHELVLEWLPDKSKKICGEVKGNRVLVYDEDEQVALTTLRHEFVDYVMCQAIEPYRKVTNKLIELLNEEAYLRKEKLADALARAI